MTACGSRIVQTTNQMQLSGKRESRKTGRDAWETIPNNQPDSILVGFFGGDLLKMLLYFDRLERISAAEGIRQPTE